MPDRKPQTPPVPGASRAYRLVPVQDRDAFGTAKAWWEARGWIVLDEGYQYANHGDWIEVAVWGISPLSQRRALALGETQARQVTEVAP